MRRHVSMIAAISLLSSGSPGQQAVLSPVKDNTLYETADGSTSNGSGDFIFVGRVAGTGGGAIRRALLKFDIDAAIPSGAAITSVSLTLTMSKTKGGTQSATLRRLNADWGEGTSNANLNEGGGAPSVAGDATWLHRFKGTSNWATPGGDFQTTQSAALQVDAVETYTFTSTSQMVADVQGWKTNPSTNFGWILIGNEASSGTANRFNSRENSTASTRPRLTVNYTTGTSVSTEQSPRLEYRLVGTYPNPFNPSAEIAYSIERGTRVRLSVFSILGERMVTLVDGQMEMGRHAAIWDASGYPSGTYLAVLEAGSGRYVRRMVLAK